MQFLALLAVVGFAGAETKVASVGGNVSTSDMNLQPRTIACALSTHLFCKDVGVSKRNDGIVHGHRAWASCL
jgi:hypothetical protein